MNERGKARDSLFRSGATMVPAENDTVVRTAQTWSEAQSNLSETAPKARHTQMSVRSVRE